MAARKATDPVEPGTTAIARLLAGDVRTELLAVMREIYEHNTLVERVAYSPQEAACRR